MRHLIIISLFSLMCCRDRVSAEDAFKNVTSDTSVVHFDTATVLFEKYIAFYKQNHFFILNGHGDTLRVEDSLHFDFEFEDFNADNLKDIQISYLSNAGGVEDLLLFDSTSGNFMKVKDFSDFPNSQSIKDTPYFYSYHRSGCADANWDSDLFIIDRWTARKIGNIAGRECGDSTIEDGIYVSLVDAAGMKPLDTLAIDVLAKQNKWDFLQNYWTDNYKRFVHPQ